VLRQLRIRNVAIIEFVDIPLTAGLNVLSGETGAGKSIIVGALGLLMGGRASADDVRTGADRATIEGEFDLEVGHALLGLLDAHGIEANDGVIAVKREVTSAGRTRAWVNGTPVTAGVLGDVGRMLVTIHGQNDAHALLDEASQRRMVDRFGGCETAAREVEVLWEARAAARAAVTALVTRRDEAAKRADYLRHVAEEIESAQLREGEDAELASESARLTHAEDLTALASELRQVLDEGDDAVVARLGHLQRTLAGIQKVDPGAERLQQLYDAAFYAAEELARESSAYAESLEHDPDRLADVERRRDQIFRLLRKHGGSVASALAAGTEARQSLDLLDTSAGDLAALQAAAKRADADFVAAADRLSVARRAAASRLGTAVERVLPRLGMQGGRFSVVLRPLEAPGPSGNEAIEYRVALNVGHDDRPLARVASGGELARVMLALQTILAGLAEVPTVIFDEVDSGIGGAVGLLVADAMREVAGRHQVFAITHLAQIASRAHNHVMVRKAARGGVTSADIAALAGADREAELARMLGGAGESEVGRAHARELLGAVSAGRPAPAPPQRAAASTSATPRRRTPPSRDSRRRP